MLADSILRQRILSVCSSSEMEVPYDTVYDSFYTGESFLLGVVKIGGGLFGTRPASLRLRMDDKRTQLQIIQSSHGDKLGGHMGREKTREKVTSRYCRTTLHGRHVAISACMLLACFMAYWFRPSPLTLKGLDS